MVVLFSGWSILGALIGWAAAERRGFGIGAGVVVGALLGPLFAPLMFFASGAASRGDARYPCPYCAEKILRAAWICPHCRTALEGTSKASEAPRAVVERSVAYTPKPSHTGRNLAIGAIVLVAFIGVAFAARSTRPKSNVEQLREALAAARAASPQPQTPIPTRPTIDLRPTATRGEMAVWYEATLLPKVKQTASWVRIGNNPEDNKTAVGCEPTRGFAQELREIPAAPDKGVNRIVVDLAARLDTVSLACYKVDQPELLRTARVELKAYAAAGDAALNEAYGIPPRLADLF